MPAINKKKSIKPLGSKPVPKKTKTLKKKNPNSKKKKLISSQLGVAVVKKSKTRNAYNPEKANRGVVFIKHIPHGFYEEQLKKYFEQFGAVTRTRVARSEKSGRSKGYAFVEFKVPDVAKIAAETMDNYLMFKHVLKTAYIPPEEQKFNYFHNTVRLEKGPNGTERLVTPKTKRIEAAVAKINTPPTEKQHQNRVARALYKLKKAEEKYSLNGNELNLSNLAHNAPNITTSSKKLNKKKGKKTSATIGNDDTPSPLPSSSSSSKTGKKGKKSKVLDTTISDLLGETIEDLNSSEDADFNPNSTNEGDSVDELSNDEQNELSDDETNIVSVKKNPKIKQQSLIAKKGKKNVDEILKNKSNSVKIIKSKKSILSSFNTTIDSSPPPVALVSTKRRINKVVESSPASPLSPKVKKSSLLARGGVQKSRSKKMTAPTKNSSTKITKMKLAANEIEKQKDVGTVKKLKAVDLKKKKK